MPVWGFYPDEVAFYPIYELIVRLGMTVLFHAGGASALLRRRRNVAVRQYPSYKYGQPGHFDTVAHAFPDLKMILAHMGGGIELDVVFYIVDNHQNVYLDTSCSTATQALRHVLRQANQFVKPLRLEKLLWGRDGYGKDEPQGECAALAEQREILSALVRDEKTLERIFCGNAETLLGM